MNDQFTVALVHQAGRVFHRAGTMEVADSEPVRVHDFEDADQAKESCQRIVCENPAFKCLVLRGEEKVFEAVNLAWASREQRRLRSNHTLSKFQTTTTTIVCLGLGVVGFLALLPGQKQLVFWASFALLGLTILWTAGTGAFAGSRTLTLLTDFVGTKDLRIARIASATGVIVGLLLMVYSLYNAFILASNPT